jgi:ABC-type glycerol-3-phosphate transport system substrate-binding protein
MNTESQKIILFWLFCIAMLLASCVNPAASAIGPVVTQHPNDEPALATPLLTSTVPPPRLTVWIDSTRMDGALIYQRLFPDKASQIDFQEVDRSQFPAEVLRFNQQGAGWPDVVFAEPELVAQTIDSQHDYPLDLNPVLPAEVLDNFELHANDACTFTGRLLCLRHDTAPMVLYFNKPLMLQFGYRLPTTWQEYQALGERVSVEHPGYIIGAFGDAWGFKAYFDASGCPSSWVLGEKKVYLDFEDTRCLRAAKLVDSLLANGTLAPYGYFNPRFNQLAQANKLLMLVAPTWMALSSFGGKPGSQYYNTADHQLGVASPLRWDGDAQVMTSAMGGGAWVISKHTENLPLALDFITWMVSAPEFWAITPDYPVYTPAQPVWEKALAANPLFANNPFPAMQSASQAISPLYTFPGYDVMGVLNDFVSRALSQKKTLESLLPDLQTAMEAQALAAGYEVTAENK